VAQLQQEKGSIGMKTTAHVAEAQAWQCYTESVCDDMRGHHGNPPPDPSPATLAAGAAWRSAYRERARLRPVGR
jgi:hypothetical protein